MNNANWVAVNAGSPSRWAINNSVKKIVFEYVKNILGSRTITPLAHFESYFNNRGRNYLAANGEGNITGFAILGPNIKGKKVKVLLVGTKPGRGYGRVIMEQIASNARERGLRRVVITDPVANARNFYRTLGYKNDPNRGTMSLKLRANKRKRSSPRSPRAPSASPPTSPPHKKPRRRTPQ